jgi:hypothetical protein
VLKRRTPRGIWALRAVTVTIFAVVLLILGSVVYSAYEDYSALRTELAPGGGGSAGQVSMQGSSEAVSINITIPNRGLFPLHVEVSCDPGDANVVCQSANVNILPGQDGVLKFRMTVVDLAKFASSDRRINGTVAISLDPFASLSAGVNLGGFVNVGGA